MHHAIEAGPRPAGAPAGEVHMLGKTIASLWPFLDGPSRTKVQDRRQLWSNFL